MALKYGAAKGLAFVNNWDQDIDRLYKREEYASQIRAEKERKTLYYANLLKKGHATNPRAEAELNDFYKGLNNELADFATENPNFETDVEGMQKFLNIQDKYLNNDILRRDMQVGQEYDKLRDAAGKGILLPEELEEEMDKYNAYINSAPGDDIEPYVFTKYQEFDVNDIIKDTVSLLGEEEISRTLDKNTGYYNIVTGVPDTKLLFGTESAYSDPKKKLIIDSAFKSYMQNNPSMASVYSGANGSVRWFQDRTRAAIDLKRSTGEMDLKIKKALSGEGQGNANAEYLLNGKLKTLYNMAGATDSEGKPVDQTMQAVEYDTNLTPFGGSKSLTITGNTRALTAKTAEPFILGGSGVNFTKTSVGNWKTIGGVPYLEVNGYIENPGSPGKYAYSEEKLKNWGFVQEEVTSGLGVDVSLNSKQVQGLKHSGTILVPMSLTEDGMTNWSKEHGGIEEARSAAAIYQKMSPEIRKLEYYNKYQINLGLTASPSDVKDLGLPEQDDRYFWTTRAGKKGIIDTSTNQFYEEN